MYTIQNTHSRLVALSLLLIALILNLPRASAFDFGVGPGPGGQELAPPENPTPEPFPEPCGFGPGELGTVFSDFGPGDDVANAVAVCPRSGKIAVVGQSRNDFAVALYNPDGSPDLAFGLEGKVTTDFDGSEDGAFDVVFQPDGRLIVVGRGKVGGDFDIAAARYLPGGALDGSFGGDGKVATGFGDHDYGWAVALQTDGCIVIGALAFRDHGLVMGRIFETPDLALVRLLPDGSLDSSFHNDGKRHHDDAVAAYEVAVTTSGRIMAISTDRIFRFNSDGSLDTSFGGGDGKMGNRADGHMIDLAVRDDESFVIVTSTHISSYDSSGNLQFSRMTGFFGNSVALQDDGKIVVAGTAEGIGFGGDFAIARFQANGDLDMSFGGGDGYVTNGIVFGDGYPDAVRDVTIQPDGKILAAGYTWRGTYKDQALARYHRNGNLDQDCQSEEVPTAIDPGLIAPHNNVLAPTEPQGPEIIFLRGDGNGDGAMNIADPTFIANYVFGIQPARTPPCQAAADANGDEAIGIADVSFLANFLFGLDGATAPPAPFPGCGIAREGTLNCESTGECAR